MELLVVVAFVEGSNSPGSQCGVRLVKRGKEWGSLIDEGV